MSADFYLCSMKFEGGLHRIMALMGDIGEMDRYHIEKWDYGHVRRFRMDDSGNVIIDFGGHPSDYHFSLKVARLAMAKYPDIRVSAGYINDEWDDCGGYSFNTEQMDAYEWYVDPDDWTNYLAGRHELTSQYRRWKENNGE